MTVEVSPRERCEMCGVNARNSIELAQEPRDAVTDGPKGADYWPSGTWPFLVKRYVEFDVSIHAHLYLRDNVVGGRVDAVTRNLCLAFKRLPIVTTNLRKVAVSENLRLNVPSPVSNGGIHDMQIPVSVVVGQTVEGPERVVLGDSVLSLKRLLPLDLCLVGEGHAANALSDGLREGIALSEPFTLQEDGKINTAMDRLAVIFRQLAGEMIEGRPELVEGLSDDQTPFAWMLGSGESSYDQIAGVGVEIRDNAVVITLEESFDLECQSFRVLYAPSDFSNFEQRVRGVHKVIVL